MSIKEELIGAELMNQNTDEEAMKIIGELDKLDAIQLSILEGFGAMSSGGVVFLEDGVFKVPYGIKKIRVFACASGGVIYAGEAVINQEIIVESGEEIPIVVGADKSTMIGEYIYLNKECESTAINSDILGIGIPLGISGGDAEAKGSWTNSTYGSIKTGEPGKGGFGGTFGFGGGGGGGGGAHYPAGDEKCIKGRTGGEGSGQDATFILGESVTTISAGQKGNDGNYGSTTAAGRGGNGGNAGGFGAGAGTAGKGGYKIDSSTQVASGNDGQGSQGFVYIMWGDAS